MIFLLIFIILPSLILGSRYFVNSGRRISSSFSKVILYILIFATGLYLSTFLLSEYDIYWSGYRSTSFIFIALSIILVVFYLTYPINKLTLIFSLTIYVSTFLLSGISIFLAWEIYDEYYKQLFYKDKKYRLEETERGFMRIPKLPKLFVKNGIFEKRYLIDTIYDSPKNSYVAQYYIPKEKIIKVEVLEIKGDTVLITFLHTADTNEVRKNPLQFKIKL
jgi:hypothetical protein